MRRADRNAKAFSERPAVKELRQILSAPDYAISETPGRGELVGGKEFQRANEFTKLARQKGGTDEIQRRLGMIEATARHEGRKGAEDHMLGIVRQNQEKHTDDVVCGFIAIADATREAHGSIAPTVTLAGHTMVCVLDALARAGYTAHGKN